MAAAFVQNGGNNLDYDPEIGQLKFYLKSRPNNLESSKFTELAIRDCETRDFINEENAEEPSEYGF